MSDIEKNQRLVSDGSERVVKYYTATQAAVVGFLLTPLALLWVVAHNYRVTGSYKKNWLPLLLTVAITLTFYLCGLMIVSRMDSYGHVSRDLVATGYAAFVLVPAWGFWVTYKTQRPVFHELSKSGNYRPHSILFLIVLAVFIGFLNSSVRYPLINGLSYVAPSYFTYKKGCDKPVSHPMVNGHPFRKHMKSAYIRCEIERSPAIGLFKMLFE